MSLATCEPCYHCQIFQKQITEVILVKVTKTRDNTEIGEGPCLHLYSDQIKMVGIIIFHLRY